MLLSAMLSVLAFNDPKIENKKSKVEQHWMILEMQRNHYSWNKVSPKLKELYYDFERKKIDNYDKP